MHPNQYSIRFLGGEIIVSAFNLKQARILAQAEAIKKGWDYQIIEEDRLPR